MVTLYTSPSCTSCRKARAWLEANAIPYKERNVFKEPLTRDEIKNILRMTEDGNQPYWSVPWWLMRSGCRLGIMKTKFVDSCHTRCDKLSWPEQQLWLICKVNISTIHKRAIPMVFFYPIMSRSFILGCGRKRNGWVSTPWTHVVNANISTIISEIWYNSKQS